MSHRIEINKNFEDLSGLCAAEIQALFQETIRAELELMITEGKYEETLIILDRLEDSIGLDIDICNMRGVIAAAQHNYQAAKTYFQKALEQNENNCDVLYNLGWLYEEQHKNIEAFLQYSKLLSSCSDTALIKEVKAKIQMFNGIQRLFESLLPHEIDDTLANYEFDIKRQVFFKKGYKYSKSTETDTKYIHDIFSKTYHSDTDISSKDFSTYIKDSISKLHLSPVRHNILEAIRPFIEGKNQVLEIGGQTGALTQWLSENCGYVDVIDEDINMSEINRFRNNSNQNVSFFADNLMNMKYPRTDYDLSTLIGVLEYIPFYYKDKNYKQACIDFLTRLSKNLKDDGLLIIALNNKLGAKYFTGCPEDHSRKLFTGLHDYPINTPVTYSRSELRELLIMSGFTNFQFYGCFPDFKFANLVLTETDDLYNLNVASIARGLFVDHTNNRDFLICDSLLLETLSNSMLLHEFPNSFLIVCSKSSSVNLGTNQLAVKFWNEDSVKPQFHHKISFIKKSNRVFVERSPLKRGASKIETNTAIFRLQNEDLTHGNNLSIEAYKSIIADQGYSSLIPLLSEVKDFLIQQFSHGQTFDNEGYKLIKGSSIDFCLHNIVRNNNELVFIDRKWTFKSALTEDYVIFRSLLNLFGEMAPFIKEFKLSDFITNIMVNLYPQYNYERFSLNLETESEFKRHIFRNPNSAKLTDITLGLDHKSYEIKKSALSFYQNLNIDTENSLIVKQMNIVEKKEELHLFLLWETARPLESRILNDIDKKFAIIGAYEIQWNRDNFANNLTRFYGQNLPSGSEKEQSCGMGPFLLIIVKDTNPYYDFRMTSKGKEPVNVNLFDAKNLYREWTGGGFKIHGTNLEAETYHDLLLLIGKRAEVYINDFHSLDSFDGKKAIFLNEDIVGTRGWESLEDLFYVLNLTNEYLVLRNFENLPYDYNSELHGDIDILTNNYADIIYITGAEKVFLDHYRVHHKIKIREDDVYFDFRYVGDNYYDRKWQKRMLRDRVRFPNGFFVPNTDQHFFSLIYHAIVHKVHISPDYIETFRRLASGLKNQNIPSTKLSDRLFLKKLLDDYLYANEYRYVEPKDLSVFYNPDIVGLNNISNFRKQLYRISMPSNG